MISDVILGGSDGFDNNVHKENNAQKTEVPKKNEAGEISLMAGIHPSPEDFLCGTTKKDLWKMTK